MPLRAAPRRVRWLVGVAATSSLVAGLAIAPAAAVDDTQRYVVVAAGRSVDVDASDLPRSARESSENYEAIDAVVAELTTEQAEALDDQPGMVVSPDGWMTLVSAQSEATNPSGDRLGPTGVRLEPAATTAAWGRDRLDQRDLPLDGDYSNNDGVSGAGVHAYVIDTGIALDHPEFAGRVGASRSFAGDNGGAGDIDGHGTHVAGTLGSSIFGVAPQVTLHSLRVVDASGGAAYSTFIAALDFVARTAVRPAVVNVSLGGVYDAAVNAAVNNLVRSGIPVVVAAGNSGDDARGYSPASAAEAITVAASDSDDFDADFSNYGPAVDLFAPGVGIASTYAENPAFARIDSGTSMAAPHVAGWVALFLQHNPKATPAAVRQALVSTATIGRIANEVSGTPDRLPYTKAIVSTPPPPLKTPTVYVATPNKAKLRINLNPNLRGKQYWTVQVRKQVNGAFVPVRAVRTGGTKEIVVVNVPRGRYDVLIPAQRGYGPTTSRAVSIHR